MRKTVAIMLVLAALITGGCAGDKGKELFETAQFEEKQGNRPHAVQLYAEIVKKYPGSELAKKAEERLSVLKGGEK
ncbi:MAG: hypothetical protein FD174_1984 [Geobacteraceae bacterium]|nr:MAG: hypothetical protein FD174_1984 [Geobacteraceae bacterium]